MHPDSLQVVEQTANIELLHAMIFMGKAVGYAILMFALIHGATWIKGMIETICELQKR